MATLTVRLKEEQMKKIEKEAADNKQTVTAYVIDKLNLNEVVDENILTQEKVLERVEELEQGKNFQIPSLFHQEEWEKYTNTVSVGRVFRILSKNPNSAVSQVAEFVEKKSGSSAIYKRK